MAERLHLIGDPLWLRYGWEHMQRYQLTRDYISNKKVLDLGCGIGYGTEILSRLGAAEVVGVDIDGEVIDLAKARFKGKNGAFQQGDAQNLPFPDDSFDVCVSFECIEHLPHPLQCVAEVSRVLKSGGTYIMSTPNTLQFLRGNPPRKNDYHINEPTYEELISWLTTHFEISQEWEQSVIGYYPEFDPYAIKELEGNILLRAIRKIAGVWSSKSQHKVNYYDKLIRRTEIFPLLPERRKSCDQFLMICQKSGSS